MAKKKTEEVILHDKEIIEEVPMEQQCLRDMQRYALYTTRHRVTSDYRDGLRPSQRRLIYGSWNDAGLKDPKKKVKSATVVGLVMDKYHPHGDASIYGTIKPMVNWFETNIPLMSKQGNFGDLQGDPCAASRYTEVGLTEFTLEVLLGDLAQSPQSVDWLPNYDDKTLEPEFLPARIPLLLINGSFGIGVGMRPEIPRHNINEVIDVTLALIDNPNAKFVLIPDHSMPCEILNADWEKINNGQILNYTVRSKIDIETDEKGLSKLIIRSIPDLTYLNSIVDEIDALIANNELTQVDRVFDNSSDDECRLLIFLKRGADPQFVRETIWKKTQAMQTCRVNLEVLIDGVPKALTYREYLLAFIEQRKLTKLRLYSNMLQDFDTKIHEREAFIKVLQSGEIDELIHLLQTRKERDDASLIEFLIKKYKLSDIQASYIINAKLKYLTPSSLDRYLAERERLIHDRSVTYNKIVHDELIVEDIKNEMIAIKNKYGRPRNCTIVNDTVNNIPAGMFKVAITQNNFIKKIPVNEQIKSTKAEVIKCAIEEIDNRDSILIFDELGRVFKLPVSKIPPNKTGTDIRFLIKNLTSDINTIIPESLISGFNDKKVKFFLVAVTEQGNIKKMDLGDFTTVPPSGILYTKLDSGDKVKSILIVSNQHEILAYAGKSAIRIPVSDIAHLKRNTKGSRVMVTSHAIEGISVVAPNSTDVIVVTRNGYINRFNISALQPKSRGKSGNQVIKLTKGDSIVGVFGIPAMNSGITVATMNETRPIGIGEIPTGSSIGPGNKMVSGPVLWCTSWYS